MSTTGASNGLAATIGANLKQARKARGLTQHQLAVEMGRGDAMTISRWERGEHRPGDENLIAVAAALGIDVADLFRELEPDPEDIVA